MKRIFIDKVMQGFQPLNKENKQYLIKTLRFKTGDSIIVFDGKNEGLAIFYNDKIEITEISTKEENLYLKLAIAEIKKDRLEWLTEKATELGIKELYILKTQRSQAFFSISRLKNIIISACKQCNRITVPEIHHLSLAEFTSLKHNKEWIFGSLNSINKEIPKETTGAIIGPEGGWTQEEESLLTKSYESIKLNNTTLRAETAAITALNYIQYSKNI